MHAAGRAIGALGGGSIADEAVRVTGLTRHSLVVVTKQGRTDAAFPRDPATRRRQPW